MGETLSTVPVIRDSCSESCLLPSIMLQGRKKELRDRTEVKAGIWDDQLFSGNKSPLGTPESCYLFIISQSRSMSEGRWVFPGILMATVVG